MTTAERSDGPSCPAGLEPLPQALRDGLRARFSPMRARYIARVLTAAELAVIADLGDALIIARIKRMPDCRLDRMDELEPASEEDRRLFYALQLGWLRDEEYLLSTQLGRLPTHRELFADFMRNHNGLRFRAYFALKYPQRVRPIHHPRGRQQ